MSALRRKFELARDRAKALKAKDDRSEAEEAEMLQMLDRAEQLKAELDEADAADARIEALGEVSRALAIPGTLAAPKEAPELSAGEYFAAVAGWLDGRDDDAFLDRAGRYVDVDRATGVSADVAGVLPVPIIGPLLDMYDGRRRVWSSFTARTMPSAGRKFERPYVTQHVGVGEQAAEGDPLTDQKFEIESDEVTKRTFGGTLDVSRQMQDWATPDALGLVVADFVKVYSRFTEAAAVTHLLSSASTTVTGFDDSTTAATVASYVNGVEAVCAAIDNDVPLTIWLSTDAAVALTKPTGANDRSTWAVVKEALSALDSEITWVTSRRLPSGTRIVGAGELIEAYEQRHGLLSLVKPTNLTTSISYSGYAAFWGDATGFRKLTA